MYYLYVAKTKALISCTVTAQLICGFVFAYAKSSSFCYTVVGFFILQDQSIQGTETKTADEVRYETACARLANEAVLRLSADNVTVLLLAITKTTAVR